MVITLQKLFYQPFHRTLVFQGQNFARVSSVLLTGYKQAVRNCPWVVEFWTGYVRAQERLGEEHEEIVGMSAEEVIIRIFFQPFCLSSSPCFIAARGVNLSETEGPGSSRYSFLCSSRADSMLHVNCVYIYMWISQR